MLAAYKRNADIVKQLLACPEIKVNAKTWNGITALMLAAYKRNANIVKQLLAHQESR